MRIEDLFPSRFLKAHDLFKLGKNSVTVTIARVDMETMGAPGKEEVKPVLHAERATKGVVLNKTMTKVLASLYGPKISDWTGKQITIVVSKYGKKNVLRIQDEAGKPDPLPVPPNYND